MYIIYIYTYIYIYMYIHRQYGIELIGARKTIFIMVSSPNPMRVVYMDFQGYGRCLKSPAIAVVTLFFGASAQGAVQIKG